MEPLDWQYFLCSDMRGLHSPGRKDMIAILSPAKNMKEGISSIGATVPLFASRAEALQDRIRALSPWEIESAMRVSPKLSMKAFALHQSFAQATPHPAAFSYDGLAYQSLDAATLDEAALLSLQARVRILSALYGVLRPLDGIRPYRLEMASRVRVEGKSLYAYWGGDIAQALYAQTDTVVNLASEEYASAVRPYVPSHGRLIDVEFQMPHKGRLRVLPTYAKIARGRMARFIALHAVDDPEDLRGFYDDGWRLDPVRSLGDRLVFTRQATWGASGDETAAFSR